MAFPASIKNSFQAISQILSHSSRSFNKKYVWPVTASAVILALYFLHANGFFQPTTFIRLGAPPSMPDRTKILRFEREVGAGVHVAVSRLLYRIQKLTQYRSLELHMPLIADIQRRRGDVGTAARKKANGGLSFWAWVLSLWWGLVASPTCLSPVPGPSRRDAMETSSLSSRIGSHGDKLL
jgi:hypothetical protein